HDTRPHIEHDIDEPVQRTKRELSLAIQMPAAHAAMKFRLERVRPVEISNSGSEAPLVQPVDQAHDLVLRPSDAQRVQHIQRVETRAGAYACALRIEARLEYG